MWGMWHRSRSVKCAFSRFLKTNYSKWKNEEAMWNEGRGRLWEKLCYVRSVCVLWIRLKAGCKWFNKVLLFREDHRKRDIYVKLVWAQWGRAAKRSQCKCKFYDIQHVWQVWILQLFNVVILTWKRCDGLFEVWLFCLLFTALPKGRQQLLLSKQ